MLVSKINLGFDDLLGGVFSMTAGRLYANNDVPEWVTKTQTFKDAKDKNLISGEFEQSKALDKELIKRATFLEINFTKDIEESALEALVEDRENHRISLINELKEKGVDIAEKAKISTIQAKLDSLTKE
jgi:hypothetical protein